MENPRKYLSNVKILNNNIDISYGILFKITDFLNKCNCVAILKDKNYKILQTFYGCYNNK